MSVFDWVVITVYLFAMFFLAAWLGRRQRSGADYFLAGQRYVQWQFGCFNNSDSMLNKQSAWRTCLCWIYRGWRYGVAAI